MLTYMIVCPLVFLAGFVDAVAGGGGLISLPAYMMAGLPAHAAIATNKISSAMGTTVAACRYLKAGFMKAWLCIPGIVMALIGSFLGSNLTLLIDEQLLKTLMLFVLPLAAIYVMKNKTLERTPKKELSQRKTIVLCSLISFFVGIYDGLYGPGTGTFLMLLFTGVSYLSLNDAAGTTKAINLTTNITALTVFILNGKVLFPLGLTAGCFNMAGNFLGSRCFTEKGADFVKPVILVVLALFFIKVLLEFRF